MVCFALRERDEKKKKKDKKRSIGTASSPIGTASSPAAPCRAGRCRRAGSGGARQPHAGPGARVPTPSASRLPPRSAPRRAPSFPSRRLPGLPGSSRRGPRGSQSRRAPRRGQRPLRSGSGVAPGSEAAQPLAAPAGAKAGSKARRSALPPRCPSPSTRSAPRGEPGPPSSLEVCRSPGAGLPPSPAEPLRFTPKFRYNRNPGQHRLIKVVISLSTAKL